MSEWRDMQDALSEHFQVTGHKGIQTTRTLDGLAIALKCMMCDESWWRAEYQRLNPRREDRPQIAALPLDALLVADTPEQEQG